MAWKKLMPQWAKQIYHMYLSHRRKNYTREQWKKYISKQYFQKSGIYPNIDQPQTFYEKIQWRKLYDHDPVYTILADKYAVREWVKKKIGEEHLIPLLGVWERAEDIDFSKLPEAFVLKTNNASGTNIIVTDRKTIHESEIRKNMNMYLTKPFWAYYGELQYKDIPPKIIAEKYIAPSNGESDLRDYKFFCFSGKARRLIVMTNRNTNLLTYRYDIERTPQQTLTFHNIQLQSEKDSLRNQIKMDREINGERSEVLQKMVQIAETLSAGFAHVRVDLYEKEGQIYFGEMTFASNAGYLKRKGVNASLGDFWDIHAPQVDHDLVGL